MKYNQMLDPIAQALSSGKDTGVAAVVPPPARTSGSPRTTRDRVSRDVASVGHGRKTRTRSGSIATPGSPSKGKPAAKPAAFSWIYGSEGNEEAA